MGTEIRNLAMPGDLIFYRVTPKSSMMSRLIAALSLLRGEGDSVKQYSHVAILDADAASCIEAVWPRVRRSSVDWADPELELWRRPLDASAAALMLDSARSMVGQRYDWFGLLFGALESQHRKICTTVVQNAFANIGIELGADAGRILTPNELVADTSLRFIGEVSDYEHHRESDAM